MKKKLLTMAMALGLAFGASAQVAQEDIQMWVGPQDVDAAAVVTVRWASPDTGFAWGVRYDSNDGLDPISALNAIASGDPRFSYTLDGDAWNTTGISALNYDDGTLNLTLSTSDIVCVYVDEVIAADASEWFYTWCDDNEGTISVFADCVLDYGTVTPAPALQEPEEESTIAATDILYWVDSGSSSAIFVLDWGTGARAWGYHFDGDVTVGEMIDAIEAADPRFANSWGSVAYFEYPVRADLTTHRIKANGVFVDENAALADGMIVKMGTPATNTWDTEITAASVATVPVDATIAASSIAYWAGEGSDSLVVIVNWGDPDTALAWGLLFDAPLTISEAIVALINADERLRVDNPLGINNIIYVDDNDSLYFHTSASLGNYLQFTLTSNVMPGWNDVVSNGDVLKFAESAYGIGVDSTISAYGMYPSYVVWPTEVHPVSNPNAGPVEPQPEDAVIAASDIRYWVGSGSNQVILAVNWADTALAWGYRFSEDSVTVAAVMDSIAAADWRFSYSGDGMLGDIIFNDGTDSLHVVTVGWWMSTLNGNSNASMGLSTSLVNGDFFKWGDYTIGVTVDTVTWAMVFPAEVHPVSDPNAGPVEPQPEDAVIAASDIRYWVGSGSNQVILAVNWADTALAWGYRFSEDSVTVAAVMDSIAAADWRFSYSGDGMLGDIIFNDGTDSLHVVTVGMWMSTLNGNSNASMGLSTSLVNGDFFKWGDYTIAVTVDTVTWAMVFPAEVYPVSVPGPNGIDGVAGVEVAVYPNPAVDMLNVSFEPLTAAAEAVLFDMTGRSVYAVTLAEGSSELHIATDGIAAGVYMLRLAGSSVKVVVNR